MKASATELANLKLKTRPRPCAQCPWRKDIEPGQFPAARYDELACTTGTPDEPAPFGSPIFTCHKSSGGNELPCAGWLAAVGKHNLTIRLAAMSGGLTQEALEPGADWPPLFESYAEMAAYQGGGGDQKWAACMVDGCRDYAVPQTVVAGKPCPTCGRGEMVNVDEVMRHRGDY